MTFTNWGIVDFQVQYWNGLGWQTVSGGSITGNNKVWKKVSFSQISTTKIRVNVTNALSSYSRVTELEAWGPGPGTNYSYDSAGNLTSDGAHSYTYDGENRLVSVDAGVTAQYAHSAANQRYKSVSGGATTHYVWDGSEVIAEHNGATGAPVADYVYSDNQLIAKILGGVTQYFLGDQLSVRLMLDAGGNVLGRQGHLPFGEDFAESGTQEKRHFTSYEREPGVGLDYAVNRWYSPLVGRFTAADPSNDKSPAIAQSWHRYAYTRNDGINNVDPEGLDLCSIQVRTKKKQESITPRAEDTRTGIPYLGRKLGQHDTNPWYVFFYEVKVTFSAAGVFIPFFPAAYASASGSLVGRDSSGALYPEQYTVPRQYDGPFDGFIEYQLIDLKLYWIDAPGLKRDYFTKTGIPVHLVGASFDFNFSFYILDSIFGIPLCDASLKLHIDVDKNGKRAQWKSSV